MKLTAKANAKINLTLDILGKREDGYHLVDMIMQTISLFDTVSVIKTDSGIRVLSSDNALGGEEDITYKAAKLFFEETKINGGAQIEIEKCIPVAAGLGGGSTDAAAVLVLLNRLYENPLTVKELEKIAVKLGADVPFFLYGGTISVGGIGEVFEKLPDMPNCHLVIAKKGVKPSTKEMYNVIDNTDVSDYRPDNIAAKSAIEKSDLNTLCQNINNVFSAAWESDEIALIMKECGALSVSLSGSGPSYFGVFDNESYAKTAVECLKNLSIAAFYAVPTKKGCEVE